MPKARRAAHHFEGLAMRRPDSRRQRTIWRIPIGHIKTLPRFHFDSKWKGIALSLQQNPMSDVPSCSFGSKPKWHCKLMLTFCRCIIPCFLFQISHCGRVSPKLRGFFESAFRVADARYYNGRVAATHKNREVYWTNWGLYCKALGVDPYL